MNFVLHIALRQASDGTGAKAQEDIAGIRRIALEVSAKLPFAQRDRHLIAGKREVIETDLQIAGLLQRIRNRCE
jgi:hypothetical protein